MTRERYQVKRGHRRVADCGADAPSPPSTRVRRGPPQSHHQRRGYCLGENESIYIPPADHRPEKSGKNTAPILIGRFVPARISEEDDVVRVRGPLRAGLTPATVPGKRNAPSGNE